MHHCLLLEFIPVLQGDHKVQLLRLLSVLAQRGKAAVLSKGPRIMADKYFLQFRKEKR